MSTVQPPQGTLTFIQQFAQQFTSTMTMLLATVDATVVDVTRVAYVTLLMVGALLYFTHVSMRLGKDLMKGGVLLVIIVEFVFPWLTRL